MLKALTTNVIFEWPKETEKKAGELYLTRDLNRDTMWVECFQVGPESILHKGDQLLLSKRVVSYQFEIQSKKLGNTSDASVLAYRRDGVLGATYQTVLYEWMEPVEETTESGIVLVRSETNKEIDLTRKAYVHAAGSKSGVKKGDTILLAYNKDAYKMENIIDGKILHNCGMEAIIGYWPA